MQPAAARAASRRGSNTRMRLPAAQSSAASARGTRVVLPAPGGATSTAVLPSRKCAVRSGRAASIGRRGKAMSSLPCHSGARGARARNP